MRFGSLVASLTTQVGSQPASLPVGPTTEAVPLIQRILSPLILIAGELVVVALVCMALYALVVLLLRAVPQTVALPERLAAVKLQARKFVLWLSLASVAGILGANGYLVVRGI